MLQGKLTEAEIAAGAAAEGASCCVRNGTQKTLRMFTLNEVPNSQRANAKKSRLSEKAL